MNIDCKKVLALLSAFIEEKLDEEESFFVEAHLMKCGDCYKKYLEMKSIINNLHFEYTKLKDELDRMDSSTFNIREYEKFYNNISPYIDNELSYDESIKFRKYLINSKAARTDLANAYGLRNNILQSVNNLKDNININFSKKIIRQLKKENPDSFDKIYKRAAIAICSSIIILSVLSLIGYEYIQKSVAHVEPSKSIEPVIQQEVFEFPDDEDYEEFSFDENHQALLTNK